MALKATIFKAELEISDLDRGYFGRHSLTIARHPSETDERMMVRLLAFALNADELLEFGRGLSAEDEGDLLRRDLTGALDLWIDVGLPDERDVRKASGRSRRVRVYAYGGRPVALWWAQNREALGRLRNLEVFEIAPEECAALTAWAARTMRLSVTVQEGEVYFSNGADTAQLRPAALKPAET